MKTDDTIRFSNVLIRLVVILLYALAAVSFVYTLAMVIKEFQQFKPDVLSQRKFLQPRWLKRYTNYSKYNYTSREDPPCLQTRFKEILLIVGFGALTEYESIPLFELLYKKTFVNRVYCGASTLPNQTEIVVHPVNTRYGAFLYDCLTDVIKNYANYSGYLFIGEDVLLNYWNMATLDLTKIWEDDSVKQGPILYEQNTDPWEWWESPWGVRAMEKVYEYFVELNYYDNRKAKLTQGDWAPDWDAGQSLNKWLWNGKGDFACYWTNTSVVYIPTSYTQLYLNITKHFRASGVRHCIAIPTVIRLLTLEEEIIKLSTMEINEENREDYLERRHLLSEASERTQIIFINGKRKERRGILNNLRLKEYAVGKFLEYRHCGKRQ